MVDGYEVLGKLALAVGVLISLSIFPIKKVSY